MNAASLRKYFEMITENRSVLIILMWITTDVESTLYLPY
jgi:hypothetical protein